MGREIRRVLPTWEHPKGQLPYGYNCIPMYDESYEDALKEHNDRRSTFDENDEEYYDEEPDPSSYMYKGKKPSPEELTHYQYYENVSEGTALSPVFGTPEELAKWLSENCDGRYIPKGNYEQFMKFIDDGWAPSMVMRGPVVSEINGMPAGNN